MKKAFTLVEVIILLVIFLMVALLVIPLSIDDTIQARHVSKWKQAHSGFSEIPTTIQSLSDNGTDLQSFVAALVKVHPLNKVVSYKIRYMNGEQPTEEYKFTEIYTTDSGATVGFKWYDTPKITQSNRKILGILMYDVNGNVGPNVWGKDVFGMNIYKDSVEAFGENLSTDEIEFDCSRHGTGLFCSTYYLNGGSF